MDEEMYTLTDFTGPRSADERTVLVGKMEMRQRRFMSVIAGAIAGILCSLVFAPFFGLSSAVVVTPLVMVIVIWAFEVRVRNGIRTSNWQTLMHRRESLVNEIVLGNEIIPANRDRRFWVQPGSQLNPAKQISPEEAYRREQEDPYNLLTSAH